MDHAWNERDKQTGDLKHRREFLDKGIRTQAELREIVTSGIEDKDTRAFRAQPSTEQGKAMSRELYAIPLTDSNRQKYELVVILNPDMKNGRLLGGTCFIPLDRGYLDKQLEIDIQRRLQPASSREITAEDVMVVGGRPALREQDSQRRIVEIQTQRQPGREETWIERKTREGRERGEILRAVVPTREQQRELAQDLDLEL